MKDKSDRELLVSEEPKERADLGESTEEEDGEAFSYYPNTEILTETMADLYMSQCLYQEAINIYERLVERDDTNQTILAKMKKARAYMLSERAGLTAKR